MESSHQDNTITDQDQEIIDSFDYVESYMDKKGFDWIKSGKKKYEARLYDRKRQLMHYCNIDKITFVNEEDEDDVCEKTIKAYHLYPSLEQALKDHLRETVLDAKTVQDGIKYYREFYPEEYEKVQGVVLLELE